jgi:hypothetical protein
MLPPGQDAERIAAQRGFAAPGYYHDRRGALSVDLGVRGASDCVRLSAAPEPKVAMALLSRLAHMAQSRMVAASRSWGTVALVDW